MLLFFSTCIEVTVFLVFLIPIKLQKANLCMLYIWFVPTVPIIINPQGEWQRSVFPSYILSSSLYYLLKCTQTMKEDSSMLILNIKCANYAKSTIKEKCLNLKGDMPFVNENSFVFIWILFIIFFFSLSTLICRSLFSHFTWLGDSWPLYITIKCCSFGFWTCIKL